MFSLVMLLLGGTTLFPDGCHFSPLQLANLRACGENIYCTVLVTFFLNDILFLRVFDHRNTGILSGCPGLAPAS